MFSFVLYKIGKIFVDWDFAQLFLQPQVYLVSTNAFPSMRKASHGKAEAQPQPQRPGVGDPDGWCHASARKCQIWKTAGTGDIHVTGPGDACAKELSAERSSKLENCW